MYRYFVRVCLICDEGFRPIGMPIDCESYAHAVSVRNRLLLGSGMSDASLYIHLGRIPV